MKEQADRNLADDCRRGELYPELSCERACVVCSTCLHFLLLGELLWSGGQLSSWSVPNLSNRGDNRPQRLIEFCTFPPEFIVSCACVSFQPIGMIACIPALTRFHRGALRRVQRMGP